MVRIGLTGGIASGKSLVSEALADHGAIVIDDDVLAHQMTAADQPAFAQIVARFGPGVVGADGELDRARLGALVFADAGARADLEAIVHPVVVAEQWRLDAAAAPGAIVVHVVPLLIEAGQAERFDEVVVVDVDPETQLQRLMSRSGLDEAAARDRIAAQLSRAERLSYADYVINNSGSVADTLMQVDRLWLEMNAHRDRLPRSSAD